MIDISKQWLRFAAVLLLLAGTAVVLRDHNKPEVVPSRRPLSEFPFQIANWHGTSLPITADELSVLGPGEFMMRDYENPAGDAVSLYIAYFPSQGTGDTIHSPKNCLPGSGWSPLESGEMRVRNTDGSTMTVNRYIVARGLSRALVLYWYQGRGHVTASEYTAKLRLVEDAIRTNRTDGALVRVVVAFSGRNDLDQAQHTALAFLAHVQPMLDEYIPR
ncbi:MAG TPA: EpsI family protein [Candidatus Acidoferrum sp.]|nr:EpsI family protein [Candidatus Acidoferrum sp.]